jgi:hypothetical protein
MIVGKIEASIVTLVQFAVCSVWKMNRDPPFLPESTACRVVYVEFVRVAYKVSVHFQLEFPFSVSLPARA